jgi:hypothetical protein
MQEARGSSPLPPTNHLIYAQSDRLTAWAADVAGLAGFAMTIEPMVRQLLGG